MFEDPIVAEIRKAREAYAASLGYDLARIVSDLQARQGQDGRPVVDRTSTRSADHSQENHAQVTPETIGASSLAAG
jgi:hypothetical protein